MLEKSVCERGQMKRLRQANANEINLQFVEQAVIGDDIITKSTVAASLWAKVQFTLDHERAPRS